MRGKNHRPPDPPSRPQMRDRNDLLVLMLSNFRWLEAMAAVWALRLPDLLVSLPFATRGLGRLRQMNGPHYAAVM